jgi:hypothetical protein
VNPYVASVVLLAASSIRHRGGRSGMVFAVYLTNFRNCRGRPAFVCRLSVSVEARCITAHVRLVSSSSLGLRAGHLSAGVRAREYSCTSLLHRGGSRTNASVPICDDPD